MTAPHTTATTDPQALQQRLDAALAREAKLAEELAARTAELAQRDSEYSERIEQQSETVGDAEALKLENQELRAAQAAGLEVLQAMIASPGATQPVFDLIARQAADLCAASAAAVAMLDGTILHLATQYWYDPAFTSMYATQFPRPVGSDTAMGRAILSHRAVQIEDLDAEPAYGMARAPGPWSTMAVPLLRGGAPLGVLAVGRPAIGRFPDNQVALLQTFAEQAVIAITDAETYRALQTRTSDLQETLEYQTATSDVLKVISRSTFDLQPVLDTLVETAARLCDADQALISRREGEVMHFAANYGFPPEYETYLKARGPVKLDPGSPTVAHRTLIEGRPVHIDDVTAVPGYPEVFIRLGKHRTSLGVPLLRGGDTIGFIQLSRQQVEPFTDRQIALVSTFADQAVIAIENTRLLTETREALEQQTATAEVLQTINASPGNLTPVFEVILNKAHSLCGADLGTLVTFDGEYFRAAAIHGFPEQHVEIVSQPFRPNSDHQKLIGGERLVHIPDVKMIEIEPGDDVKHSTAKRTDVRTLLAVPLRKDGTLLGFISACRLEVRAFADREIALLENFAAQAVIAMENARLIAEQREALEQQTATAEVLGVINSNPGDLAPVFDAMLEKAHGLCGIAMGSLELYDGQRFRAVSVRGLSDALADMLRQGYPASENPATRPLIDGGRLTHIRDVRETDYAITRSGAELDAARTLLCVPLRREGALLGMIASGRKEVRPFSDKEIALLENFAAQAVIAMENARLLNEQREALEQQTATAEVLQVINANPGNLAPVFEAILEKAHRICGATIGSLIQYDGECLRATATHGFTEEFAAFLRQPFRPSGRYQRLIDGERFVQAMPGDAMSLRQAEVAGVRTTLAVPLRKDTVFLGAITAHRTEVRPFGEREIVLLENFASQAVIAMENARLLDEIRQRQAELRVTFDNMGDGVVMFDAEHRLAAWNRNFQELLDLPDAALAKRPSYADYLRLLAERGEFGAEDVEAELTSRLGNTDRELRLERTRPDGRVIELRRNPVPDGGFVLIYSDISERKRSEAEIRAARDAAEAAYRDLKAAQANLIQAEKMASLGQLTAGIAHEIKNPLNFVNNFAELSVDLLGELKDAIAPAEPALTEKQRAEVEEVSVMLTSNLEKIAEHGRRADSIVKNMLLHSRTGPSEHRAIDVNTTVEEALNLAYHGARAETLGFNITMDKDLDPKAGSIDAFPQEFLRVMLNLISNGFYAARKRANAIEDNSFEPTLHVSTRNLGSQVEIRVRDNGTGIGDEARDKIFEPFFTTKPAGEGTGLGLSLSYDIIVKQHGGQLTVDSRPNEFTEFQIILPRRMAANGGGRA